VAARRTASLMAGANGAKRRAAPSRHKAAARLTSDELTVLYSNGPDDRSVTPHCKAHGGGKRCQTVDCFKASRGDTGHCSAHGGGRRCQEEGCLKGAEGGTLHCKAHGGGRRCQTVDCSKSALGDTGHCIAHGGGRRCQHEGCTKAAVQDGTLH
jgi:hypothetical protein